MIDHEEKIRSADKELISNNTEENRATLHKLNVEYIRFLKWEKSILKQKSQCLVQRRRCQYKIFSCFAKGEKKKTFYPPG